MRKLYQLIVWLYHSHLMLHKMLCEEKYSLTYCFRNTNHNNFHSSKSLQSKGIYPSQSHFGGVVAKSEARKNSKEMGGLSFLLFSFRNINILILLSTPAQTSYSLYLTSSSFEPMLVALCITVSPTVPTWVCQQVIGLKSGQMSESILSQVGSYLQI